MPLNLKWLIQKKIVLVCVRVLSMAIDKWPLALDTTEQKERAETKKMKWNEIKWTKYDEESAAERNSSIELKLEQQNVPRKLKWNKKISHRVASKIKNMKKTHTKNK